MVFIINYSYFNSLVAPLLPNVGDINFYDEACHKV